jgi:hypothetical protein
MADRIYLRHPVTDETVSVSTGFSWPAFLLGAIWALMKKLWLIALLMLVVELLIGVIGLAGTTADVISFVLSLAFAVFCGMNGNKWHRRAWERKGYVGL